jgi:hypothetical protein
MAVTSNIYSNSTEVLNIVRQYFDFVLFTFIRRYETKVNFTFSISVFTLLTDKLHFRCVSNSTKRHISSHVCPHKKLFKKTVAKIQFGYNLTRIAGILHAELCKFLVVMEWILMRMRNVSDIVWSLCTVTFFPPSKSCHSHIKWKNIVQPDRPQVTINCSIEKFSSHTI